MSKKKEKLQKSDEVIIEIFLKIKNLKKAIMLILIIKIYQMNIVYIKNKYYKRKNLLSQLTDCVEELKNVGLNKYNTMEVIEFFRAQEKVETEHTKTLKFFQNI